jgi:diacylglycerol kinase (ATP)
VSWLDRNFSRLWWATRYSLAGLKMAWRHEQAFRQEAAILIVVIPAALWLGKNGVERAVLVGSWLFVMIVELINTAIESVVDRIGPERHELAGRAKDLGSAGVFCSIALAVAVWLIILLS